MAGIVFEVIKLGKRNNSFCALVIGHSADSQGAKNKRLKMTEFSFNCALAYEIKSHIPDSVELVFRDSYQLLPFEINGLNPAFIVSLHANAYDTNVSGCETLYYHTSNWGRYIASIMQDTCNGVLANRNRGIKAKTEEDRGGYLLRYTNPPAVICEPFFIDNDEDAKNASNNIGYLAGNIAAKILLILEESKQNGGFY